MHRVLKGSLEAGVYEGSPLRNQADNTEIRCSLALLGSDGLLLNLAERESAKGLSISVGLQGSAC
jgi:hypothetical protein